MKREVKNKTVKIFLFVSVVIVWGLISFKIINYFLQNDSVELEIEVAETSRLHDKIESYNTKITEHDYKKLERDPFTLQLRKQKIVKPKTEIKPPVKQAAFNYKIDGLMINGDKKVILLNDISENKTVYLKEGDKYKTLTINEITSNLVSLKENSLLKKLNLK